MKLVATIKMPISKVKLSFYPPCEVKCRLQNGVSTIIYINIQNSNKPKNGTPVLTSTEVYCSAGQIGTASGTRLTPLV